MTARNESASKDRVLAAALHEFATRGYEAASTNTIASRAGVAKGLVFHHFGSKEQLFVAVFEQVLEEVQLALVADISTLPSDLFERLFAWHIRKVELMQKRPEAFELFLVALKEAPPPVQARMAAAQERVVAEAMPQFLQGIDTARLKPGLSLNDAIDTIFALAEGLEKRIAAESKQGLSLHQIAERAWIHFARLRDGLYTPKT